ncbi:MAG: beta-glucosidase, partial [Bacteroidaceae bacterium]|nr:beta-glucosidase [Bacteroidaceae bacterium]
MKKIFLFLSVVSVGFSATEAQELKLTSDNINKVIKAMTLEEKVAIIVGKGSGAFDGRGRSYDYVAGSAGATNPIDRLGIPPIVYADGPSGLRIDNKQCTRFPNGLLNAASWNSDMLERMGEAYG